MNNAQKTPLARTLPVFTAESALNEIKKTGRALPGHVISASGPIVTVSFDVNGLTLGHVQMPLFGPEYIRYPIQPGDKGVAFPVDFYIGGVSGLGGGTADTTPRGNPSTLVWFPCGNVNWTPVDPNAVTIYGPNGVTMRDSTSESVFAMTQSNTSYSAPAATFSLGQTFSMTAGTSISLSAGGHTIVISAAGVVIDGKEFLTHVHTGVQSGGSDTGPVGP